MNYLLDTHTFLWFINDDSNLSSTASSLIQDPDNNIFLSVASIWEIAIKISLRKLELSEPFEKIIPEELALNGINELNIKLNHISALINLPLHHRDPFDRLIIAQSIIENMPLISKDRAFNPYPVKIIW